MEIDDDFSGFLDDNWCEVVEEIHQLLQQDLSLPTAALDIESGDEVEKMYEALSPRALSVEYAKTVEEICHPIWPDALDGKSAEAVVKVCEGLSPCALDSKSAETVEEISEHPSPGALYDKSAEVIEELQLANRILHTIRHVKSIQPFYGKRRKGLCQYKAIKVAISFHEVKRKLDAGEYEGLAQFLLDIRLLFEHSFRFWGPQHRITKKGLILEEKLEEMLQELPRQIFDKLYGEISKGYTNTSALNEPSAEEMNNDNPIQNLLNIYKCDEDETGINESYDAMISWEREHIADETASQEIRSMWELAEIGSFFRLTYKVLKLNEITQYEVERMLLMPKESMTLMKIMTSMLRGNTLNLYGSLLAPYEIWNAKLKKQIDEWMALSSKIIDPVILFEETGVDPYFWQVIKSTNPLNRKLYHEIPFRMRVIILKALCDYIFHTSRTIKDALNEINLQSKIFRPKYLGQDDEGIKYVSLSFWSEIRVYKETKLKNKDHLSCDNQESSTLYNQTNKLLMEAEDTTLFGERKMFQLIAYDLDSLGKLIEELKLKQRFAIVSKLNFWYINVKWHKIKHDGLKALYRQWHEYRNRNDDYFSRNMANLWLNRENAACTRSLNRKVCDQKESGEYSQSGLGKETPPYSRSLNHIVCDRKKSGGNSQPVSEKKGPILRCDCNTVNLESNERIRKLKKNKQRKDPKKEKERCQQKKERLPHNKEHCQQSTSNKVNDTATEVQSSAVNIKNWCIAIPISILMVGRNTGGTGHHVRIENGNISLLRDQAIGSLRDNNNLATNKIMQR